MTKQFALDIRLPDDQTFSSFISGDNEIVVSFLLSLFVPSVTEQPFLTFVQGAQGTGKSHLLVALCNEAERHNLSQFYFVMDRQLSMPTQILDGLEQQDLVCIDNVDLIQGNPEWELALFNLINRVKERKECKLVLSANAGPKSLKFLLPDLASRLAWGTSFSLAPLTDEQREQAIVTKAKLRGINMPRDAARFLLNHTSRDMRSLTATLDTLDQKTLQEKRKMTIPFIKQTLSL